MRPDWLGFRTDSARRRRGGWADAWPEVGRTGERGSPRCPPRARPPRRTAATGRPPPGVRSGGSARQSRRGARTPRLSRLSRGWAVSRGGRPAVALRDLVDIGADHAVGDHLNARTWGGDARRMGGVAGHVPLPVLVRRASYRIRLVRRSSYLGPT